MNSKVKTYITFQGLKGYNESLNSVSKEKVNKKVLLEDKNNIVNNILKNIKVNDLIKIIYYNRDNYFLKRGLILELNYRRRYLLIDNAKIFFKDIYDIELTN